MVTQPNKIAHEQTGSKKPVKIGASEHKQGHVAVIKQPSTAVQEEVHRNMIVPHSEMRISQIKKALVVETGEESSQAASLDMADHGVAVQSRKRATLQVSNEALLQQHIVVIQRELKSRALEQIKQPADSVSEVLVERDKAPVVNKSAATESTELRLDAIRRDVRESFVDEAVVTEPTAEQLQSDILVIDAQPAIVRGHSFELHDLGTGEWEAAPVDDSIFAAIDLEPFADATFEYDEVIPIDGDVFDENGFLRLDDDGAESGAATEFSDTLLGMEAMVSDEGERDIDLLFADLLGEQIAETPSEYGGQLALMNLVVLAGLDSTYEADGVDIPELQEDASNSPLLHLLRSIPAAGTVEASLGEVETAIVPTRLETEIYLRLNALESDQSETVQPLLEAVVLAGEEIKHSYAPGAEDQVDQDITLLEAKMEKVCSQLFEYLGLDVPDALIKQYITAPEPQEILSEELAGADKLNNKGFYKYKPPHLKSLLSGLTQFIKQKLQPWLMVGRYALRFSLA